MLRRFRGQTIDRGNELEWRMWTRQPVPLHQVLCEKQITDCGQNCDQQNANRAFALVQQLPDKPERSVEIPLCQRVTQFEDDSGAREWDQITDNADIHCALLADEDVDLVQFVLNLPRVAARQQDKQLERIVAELEFPFFCARARDFSGLFFPAAPGRVEPIENL